MTTTLSNNVIAELAEPSSAVVASLSSHLGSAIATLKTTPYIGPVAKDVATLSGLMADGVKGMFVIATNPMYIGMAAAIIAAAGMVKEGGTSAVKIHLCKQQCSEKFLLDPEKRWRCQKYCKKIFGWKLPFQKIDKYSHLKQSTKEFKDDEIFKR